MPSNPMQRKIRNSFLLGIAVTLIIVIIIGAVLFFTMIKPKLEEEEEREQQVYAYAYRLKPGVNVESGDEINKTMVESVEIPVTTQLTDFIAAKTTEGNDITFKGTYKSKIALNEGTILTYSMFMDEEETNDSTRYMEYSMITMPTTLEEGDFVDIRLRLSNAQDLIVIAKKEIKRIYGQTLGFNLSEEEILILNSAIVEGYIMPASELYITTYVEPGIQETAQKTYRPTNEVIALINADENIINTAKNSLYELYSKSGTVEIRNQVNSVINQNLENADENIRAGIKEQINAARKAREEYLSEMNGY